MTKFEKTKTSFGYQITATGNMENREAVITKFHEENKWWVAEFRDGEVFKSAEFFGAFKTLSDAKWHSETLVEA